ALPAAATARSCSTCLSVGDATTTASTAGSDRASSRRAETAATPPAARSAAAGSGSTTRTRRAPGTPPSRWLAWRAPMRPAPTTATPRVAPVGGGVTAGAASRLVLDRGRHAMLAGPEPALLVRRARRPRAGLAGDLGDGDVPPRPVGAAPPLGVHAHDDDGHALGSLGAPQGGLELLRGVGLDGGRAHGGGVRRVVDVDDGAVEPARARVAPPELVRERGRAHRALQPVDRLEAMVVDHDDGQGQALRDGRDDL